MVGRVLSIVCLGAIALFISACGEAPEGGSNVKLVEGGGIVKYNGAPLAGANVTFVPKNGPVATGTTDVSGKFKLTSGPMAGVAVGDCKVTVTAYEGSTKPAAENFTMPSSAPSDPEAIKKKMNLGNQMKSVQMGENAAAGPKSIIPEDYGKLDKTTLSFKVEPDATKNQFTIDLKD